MRFLFFILFLAFPLMTSTLWAQPTRPTQTQVGIEKRLIEGEKYTFLGDWEKAEPIFRAILEDDVQNSAACYQLSRTLLALGKTSDALTFIRKAIRIEPDNEWYLVMEADIHERIGDQHATLDVYERIIDLHPGKPQYYEMVINLCKKTGQPLRLLAILDKYESFGGLSESIARNRFETLDGLERKTEALQALHALTIAYPGNTDYKYLAASYARQTGQEQKALDYYKEILLLHPDDARAKLALAGTEKKEGNKAGYLESILPILGDPAVAINVKLDELIPYVLEYAKSKDPALGAALNNVIAQLNASHPNDAKVSSMEGDVHSIAGNDAQAIEAYTESTRRDDNNYIVWEQLIGLLMRNHRYEELSAQALKAIEIFPNQGFLYYAAGYGFFNQKEYSEAMDMLTQALLMTGKNPGQKINVLNLMAMTYDGLGDVDKSTASFESSLSLQPRNPETLAYYALSLSKRITKSDLAVQMADRVVADGHSEGYLHRILAEAYFHQRQFDKANTSIQIAVKEGTDGSGYNLAGDILLGLGKKEEAVQMWQEALTRGYDATALKRKLEAHRTP